MKQFNINPSNSSPIDYKLFDKLIKEKLSIPGSRVSISGPGGSGKSQLAFKSIREYINKGIFDFVIPIYFDEGLIQFDKFLLQLVEPFAIKPESFENNTVDEKKGIIRDLLVTKKHPLVYLDNFETVSLILNTHTGTEESKETASQIRDFLDNIIPTDNTSILLCRKNMGLHVYLHLCLIF